MKRFFTFTLSLLIPALLLAGNSNLPSSQATKSNPDLAPHQKKILKSAANVQQVTKRSDISVVTGVQGLIDTLEYRSTGRLTTHFGFDPQDVNIMWFVAPADLTIKAAGFNSVVNDGDPMQGASLKIVKMAWTLDQLRGGVDGIPVPPLEWGYFEAVGNGVNDRAPFALDEGVTGDWVAVNSPDEGVTPIPFENAEEELWSDGGYGADIVPEHKNAFNGDYQWVQMSILGFEPTVLEGEIFGIVLRNTSSDLASPDNWTIQAGQGVANTGLKFYAQGRLNTDPASEGYDGSWWTRAWTFDYAVSVDITGNVPPQITNATILPGGTLDQGPQTITANVVDPNPSGGETGLPTLNLNYSTDGRTSYTAVAMTNTTGDEYTADIPGQVPGTRVYYYINAIDPQGKEATSFEQTYVVFQPENPTLLVFNGFTTATGYPQDYYFGQDDFEDYNTVSFDHDVWAYSALTEELVNNYTNIIEITSNGPNYVNDDVIAAWIAADAGHNYALAGDEYLGNIYGWPGEAQDIPASDFANEIMGIETYIDDIVLFGSTGPSHFITVEGSLLGDALHKKVDEIGTDRDSLQYDPNLEISVANWLDAVVSAEDCETFLQADTGEVVYTIGHTRTLTAGNKIAFFSYDPLSLNATGGEYYWYGFSLAAPQVQLLDWFGITYAVGLEDADNVTNPVSFSLKQNFPNPFNPSTTIKYSVPSNGKVELKVFDVSGREVATLVNKVQAAGEHVAAFGNANLASGVYFYTLKSGDLTSTKKMLLLK